MVAFDFYKIIDNFSLIRLVTLVPTFLPLLFSFCNCSYFQTYVVVSIHYRYT